ncbi:voltage-gated potassium channel [Heliocybe sulcata]|uniref:Voltage-gated potassium channel n=1 Tax=Heliocybe sulcata TaxID=5364 RepID=A0A5C3MWT2_9AGAM|nr:voltage-gated potassium channel [Heliocybe sulcata]
MVSVPLIATLYAVWDRVSADHDGSKERRDQDLEKARTELSGSTRDHDAEPERTDVQEEANEEDSEDFPRTNTFLSLSSPQAASWWSKLKGLLFPPYGPSLSNLDEYIPNYRSTPILAGIVVPFSILLEIPGLTDHWYIRTVNHQTVDYRSNPPILDAGLAISMACGVLANMCLIARFLEKRVKAMTILCVVFLTLHDIINIVAVTFFGVVHRYDDGFTYGEAFWLTVCSTVASVVTNVTLLLDLVRTKDFSKSGSGLTPKQRALVLIVMVLLLQIALGSAVNSALMDLQFIDGLYFTVVSIETIGFGDITPASAGARVWVCAYSTIGIINLGVAVGMARETVIEGLEVSYRKRVAQLRAFRQSERDKRKAIVRWKAAAERQLKDLGVEPWIPDEDHSPKDEGITTRTLIPKILGKSERIHWLLDLVHIHFRHHPGYDATHSFAHHGYRLNIDGLNPAQLEACALEAGVPLDLVLPETHRARQEHADFLRKWYGHWRPPPFLPSFGARKLLGMKRRHPHRHRNSDEGQAQTEDGNQQDIGVSLEQGSIKDRRPHNRTHVQLGQMAEMMTRFALGVMGAHAAQRSEEDHAEEAQEAEHERADLEVGGDARSDSSPGVSSETATEGRNVTSSEVGDNDKNPEVEPVHKTASDSRMRHWKHLEENSIYGTYDSFKSTLENEEKKAFYVKFAIVWSLFLTFWMVGSAVFSRTERWPFGTAMYFCFISFTTIGYGDLSPQTPAGRAIFVVWALLGVATMTILISVISDAYGSRYKSAMHTQAFNKAVKRYRARARHEPGPPRPVIEATASGQPLRPRSGTIEESHARVQEQLEQLPAKILEHARTFHEDIQYFVNTTARDMIAGDSPAGGAGAAAGTAELRVPSGLKGLLDDIAKAEGIGERVKNQILQDDEARNTLFMLSIEKSLKKMIAASEGALQALAERDALRTVRIPDLITYERSLDDARMHEYERSRKYY